jgi:hypothetical protein
VGCGAELLPGLNAVRVVSPHDPSFFSPAGSISLRNITRSLLHPAAIQMAQSWPQVDLRIWLRSTEPIMVLRNGKSPGAGSLAKLFDSDLADVKAATPLAAIDCELIAFTTTASCSIPEIESDAVSLSRTAVVVEDFAASRIGAWKNQFHICHSDRPFRPGAADLEASRPRRITLRCG